MIHMLMLIILELTKIVHHTVVMLPSQFSCDDTTQQEFHDTEQVTLEWADEAVSLFLGVHFNLMCLFRCDESISS